MGGVKSGPASHSEIKIYEGILFWKSPSFFSCLSFKALKNQVGRLLLNPCSLQSVYAQAAEAISSLVHTMYPVLSFNIQYMQLPINYVEIATRLIVTEKPTHPPPPAPLKIYWLGLPSYGDHQPHPRPDASHKDDSSISPNEAGTAGKDHNFRLEMIVSSLGPS